MREVDSIKTARHLAEFICELRGSLDDGSHVWEHAELGPYLEAMAAWLDDMEGYYQNRNEPVPSRPDWAFMGKLLVAASVYE